MAAHEIAHGIDDIAGKIPVEGIKKELSAVYNDLNNPDLAQRRVLYGPTAGPTRAAERGYAPGRQGYTGDLADRELVAEGLRAYMTNPNYFKTVAPKSAEVFRKYVNENPLLNKEIHLNVGGMPFLASPQQRQPTPERKRNLCAPTGRGVRRDFLVLISDD